MMRGHLGQYVIVEPNDNVIIVRLGHQKSPDAGIGHYTKDISLYIDEAYKTLGPLLGSSAALTFAIALLASGIASSTTGTLAGQIVFEAFFRKPHINILKIRVYIRLATMIPAAIAILLSASPLSLLVMSQVVLSLQLPFAVIPLVMLTSDPALMGELVNTSLMKTVAWGTTILIVVLNLWLLLMLAWDGVSAMILH